MDRYDLRFPVMGTEAHVAILATDPELAGRARHRLEELESRWSRFRPDSEISQLNRSSGAPIVVSPETFEVIAAAIGAWRWSGGRFDPTLAATMDLAGYRRWSQPDRDDHHQSPVRHQPGPGPAGIVLDPYPGSVAVPADVAIDLGGIGKGAAADLVAAELLAAGAAGCSINLGGDVRVAGRPPRSGGWRIAIEADDGAEPITVGVIDGAVCTSSSAGRRWVGELGAEHHLRDPRTGGPLATGLIAVTVLGARATQAEVLTKAAFAAGPAEAAELITGVGATGVMITDDHQVILLDGLGPFLAAAEAEIQTEAVA